MSVDYNLYTDGACPGNPGRGGTGVYIEIDDGITIKKRESFKGYFSSNNQRMELRAAIDGLRLVRSIQKEFGYGKINWYTDSKYVANHIFDVPKWKKGKLWTTSSGEPVSNSELWTDLEAVRSSLRIYPNHIDRENNKEADRLATFGAKNPGYTDFGYNPGRIGKSKGGKGRATSLYGSDHKNLKIRVFLVSGQVRNSNLCKVKFEIVESEGKFSSEKYHIWVSSDIQRDLHRTYEYVVNTGDGRIIEIIESNWNNEQK